MFFRQFFDERLAQYSYLIGCQKTGEAVVIDPERDIDRYVKAAEAEGLTITAVADTHIHADYLTGAREFAERGVTVYVSDEGDENWKYEWAQKPKETGGSYDVEWLYDGDTFSIGNVEITALHTPGHTPGHTAFVSDDLDAAFVGDVVMERDGRLHPSPWILSYDTETVRESIHDLADRAPAVDVIGMGHGTPFNRSGSVRLAELGERIER